MLANSLPTVESKAEAPLTATDAVPTTPRTAALMRLGPRPPQVFVRGQGSWLWDSAGRRYLDLVQGWAVNALGHAPKPLAFALAEQSARLLHAGPGLHNAPAARLAERLAVLSGLPQVFIATSGSEANEGAVKLARKWGQLQRGGAATVLTFDHSFHGRTLALMSASGKPGFDRLFPPAVPGFVRCPFNDLDATRQTLAAQHHTLVAVMLELVQGEAGVVEATPAFVHGLRALCDAHGLLLIIDEVQTGIGRCGPLFLHTDFGVQPDILTLGKGLGGGVPIGALLARDAVSCFAPGDQGGTFHGNALVCAAALALLDEVTAPGFLDRSAERGEQLAAGLRRLSARHRLHGVHGRGLLRALALPDTLSAAGVADAAREPADPTADGLLVNPARPRRLRLMPALNISADEVDHALRLLDAALARAGAPA